MSRNITSASVTVSNRKAINLGDREDTYEAPVTTATKNVSIEGTDTVFNGIKGLSEDVGRRRTASNDINEAVNQMVDSHAIHRKRDVF